MKTLPIKLVQGAPAAAAPPPWADPRWRLARVLSAPHRLGFFAAAALFAVTATWWLLALATRPLGIALPWAVPPQVAHGLVMSLGFLPLFIVGFLFTAGPKWLAQPEVPARVLQVPVALMVVGWLLALAGFHVAAPLAACGAALAAAGWGALVLRFGRLLFTSRAPDRQHAALVAVGGVMGVLAMALAAGGLLADQVVVVRVATQVALWGFLAPTFAVVSHRMIPFFTASAVPGLQAWRPTAILWALVATMWLEGAGQVAELLFGPLPAALRWAQVAAEVPAALLVLWLAVRWGLVQSLRIRLLLMLHAGFCWLGIAIGLAAASHAAQALTGEATSLGVAPLHALTMGYLGTTLFAMVTRVVCGHSGRPLVADDVAWALYWLLHAAAVLRVAGAVAPAAQSVLLLAAAGGWAVVSVGWAWRYGGWLGRPRADGRPG